MPDEKIASVTELLRQALAHFVSFGIRVRQLMSDSSSAYRSHPVAAFLQKLRIEDIFILPYTPRTNGKAERFIQTSLREWALRHRLPKLSSLPATSPTLDPPL